MKGHYYTISRAVFDQLCPVQAPAAVPWGTTVEGGVRLSGALRIEPAADRIVVIVHGLGGNADSGYVRRAAQACAAAGWSSLRVSLRGADGAGEGIYHAGLVTDIDAIVDDAKVRDHRYVVVLGYSLGGHVALRHAIVGTSRVHAIAAVCAPLDLSASCRAIDRPTSAIYRRHVLSKLKRAYRAVARRRSVPTAHARVDRIKTIREWDEHVVAPWFGFDSPEDYYARMSVGAHLGALGTAALYVGSDLDPMVPQDVVLPSLAQAEEALEVWMFATGGHVGFPRRLTRGTGRSYSLEAHLLQWFAQKTAPQPK